MFTRLLVFLVLGTSLLLAGCNQQQETKVAEKKTEKIVWTLAKTWGAGFPIFGDAVNKMAAIVKVTSSG